MQKEHGLPLIAISYGEQEGSRIWVGWRRRRRRMTGKAGVFGREEQEEEEEEEVWQGKEKGSERGRASPYHIFGRRRRRIIIN